MSTKSQTWRRQDFHYELPDSAIARHPTAERTASRLLHLARESGAITHRYFHELSELLRPGDVLVLNDTKVIPARLFGRKETGGQVELLIERVLNDYEVLTHIRASKSPKPGSHLILGENNKVQVFEKYGEFYHLKFAQPVMAVINALGRIPLPPYMEREDTSEDSERYQTVFADRPGAVAAPTASLHFDESLLSKLEVQGIELAKLTLHVGSGTFAPMRVEDIAEHQMHQEWMELPANTCEQINQAKREGRRIIAVGTTVVRCLETAAQSGQLRPYSGETDIFIYPGYEFQVVDGLITNFHLPESTLLMLVSAFAGYETVMQTYKTAVAEGYRFFSYGDAMVIL